MVANPGSGHDDSIPSVRISGLTFSYGRQPFIDGLDLDLPTGKTGLLGLNGAGKSTLIKLIVGLLKPAVGTLAVGGSASLLGSSVGYCPQSPVMPGQFRVAEFLHYLCWVRRLPRREANVARALEIADLTDRRREQLSRLSGGQSRRLAVAQALMGDPALVLLDEPTAGLDPAQRLRMREVLAALPDSTTVLISSHLLEDVTQTCTRVVVLQDGAVTAQTTVADDDASLKRLEALFVALLRAAPE